MATLAGEVVLVTGGARGIGRTYASRLASRGAAIGVIDMDLRSFREDEAESTITDRETVIEELNRLGYRTRTGKPWRHPQQIIKLLRSFIVVVGSDA